MAQAGERLGVVCCVNGLVDATESHVGCIERIAKVKALRKLGALFPKFSKFAIFDD